jgi:hypothetical protein
VVHHVVVGLEVDDVVVDGAYGYPHGWSGKMILMNATLSSDVGA